MKKILLILALVLIPMLSTYATHMSILNTVKEDVVVNEKLAYSVTSTFPDSKHTIRQGETFEWDYKVVDHNSYIYELLIDIVGSEGVRLVNMSVESSHGIDIRNYNYPYSKYVFDIDCVTPQDTICFFERNDACSLKFNISYFEQNP